MIIPMLCVTIFVILVVWFLLPRVARLMIHTPTAISIFVCLRSEERRVGKECRSRWSRYHYKINSTVDIFTFYVPHRHVYGEQWIKFMKDGVNATPLFSFKQKTAYENALGIPAEPLFRSRDIGRMVLAAEGRKANDSHADCYQYFCVPEYGTANGRLHFHAVHFMRTLPTGSVDPNFGRRVRNRRQLNSLQNTWPYGYSMP